MEFPRPIQRRRELQPALDLSARGNRIDGALRGGVRGQDLVLVARAVRQIRRAVVKTDAHLLGGGVAETEIQAHAAVGLELRRREDTAQSAHGAAELLVDLEDAPAREPVGQLLERRHAEDPQERRQENGHQHLGPAPASGALAGARRGLEHGPIRHPEEEHGRAPFVGARNRGQDRLPPFDHGGVHGISDREPLIERRAERDRRPVGDGKLHGDHGRQAAEHQGSGHAGEGVHAAAVGAGRVAGVEEDEPQRLEVLEERGQGLAGHRLGLAVRPFEEEHPFALPRVEAAMADEVKDMERFFEEMAADGGGVRRLPGP